MELELIDLSPGDAYVRTLHLTDKAGNPVTGYTATARISEPLGQTAYTASANVAQGTGDEWDINIPSTETSKVPNKKGTVLLQVKFAGPQSFTLQGPVHVSPNPQ